MRSRRLCLSLLASLCSLCLPGCSGDCGADSTPFTLDETYTADDLQAFEEYLGGDESTELAADATCEELCGWGLYDANLDGDEDTIDSCEATFDAGSAELLCTGTSAVYCK